MTVTLRRMTAEEFGAWKDRSISSFAADLAKATGTPLPAALERAREEFPRLLPDGLDSDRTWLMTVVDDDGTGVGTLWLGRHPARPDTGYVFDIEIEEAQRSRGFGKAAMTAAEQLLAGAGFRAVALNVFGFNERARGLYDSLGYRVVATTMSKALGDV